MKNELIEPKYKIGDVCIFIRNKVYIQGVISRAGQEKEGYWTYIFDIAGGVQVNEEDIIKKL